MDNASCNQDTVRDGKAADFGNDAPSPRAVKSSRLFGGSRMLIIEHAGETYRLQITKNEKLILTK